MYIIKKGMEYFFPEIDKRLLDEAMQYLSGKEQKIFENMSKYDQSHSLEVYKKLKNTELKNDKLYLRLALLHDCGKGKVSLVTRIFHKFGLKTILKNHTLNGYKKIKNIDKELSILIKNHHNKNYSDKMSIFQKCDDES
ncbi:HD domain-containing protein [Leptotrichia sp. OH3620_COT-345]|uniref:HD domain-containing protein n=1 Tax=Leptotrichia sp. OH3620_COT-345 TaxID=2491048 RepID=UPI000F64BDF0|nr:HD domain-containing protein [Leptotrichia sp. OH3620_COT-345]RRD40981.1 HD domain-containing protein [Leptotrichia sp. OH3620_COT-345]